MNYKIVKLGYLLGKEASTVFDKDYILPPELEYAKTMFYPENFPTTFGHISKMIPHPYAASSAGALASTLSDEQLHSLIKETARRYKTLVQMEQPIRRLRTHLYYASDPSIPEPDKLYHAYSNINEKVLPQIEEGKRTYRGMVKAFNNVRRTRLPYSSPADSEQIFRTLFKTLSKR
jgi:hypothetical protein